jgi:hypothetical protein
MALTFENFWQCRFRFLSGAGNVDVLVSGLFLDDGSGFRL